jgi:putative ABC transport system permease protein
LSGLTLVVSWALENRTRSVLTMLSVTVAFVLFGLVQGLNQGVDALIASARTDRLLVASRASVVGFLPISHLDRIRRPRAL